MAQNDCIQEWSFGGGGIAYQVEFKSMFACLFPTALEGVEDAGSLLYILGSSPSFWLATPQVIRSSDSTSYFPFLYIQPHILFILKQHFIVDCTFDGWSYYLQESSFILFTVCSMIKATSMSQVQYQISSYCWQELLTILHLKKKKKNITNNLWAIISLKYFFKKQSSSLYRNYCVIHVFYKGINHWATTNRSSLYTFNTSHYKTLCSSVYCHQGTLVSRYLLHRFVTQLYSIIISCYILWM